MELIAGRKTGYNNHHQFSIVGSGVVAQRQFGGFPDNTRSPNNKRDSPIKDLQKSYDEGVYSLGMQKQESTNRNAQYQPQEVALRQEVEQIEEKN